MFAGHTGVVVKLVEAVTVYPDSQDTLLQLLLTAFHAESQLKICAPLFLAMTAYEVYTEEKKDESKVIPFYEMSNELFDFDINSVASNDIGIFSIMYKNVISLSDNLHPSPWLSDCSSSAQVPGHQVCRQKPPKNDIR